MCRSPFGSERAIGKRAAPIVMALLVLQGCEPRSGGDATAATVPAAPPPASMQSVDTALDVALSERLGVAAKLQGAHERQIGPWTFVCGRPVQASGAPMDYATTTLRDQAAEGMVDDQACALIERTGAGASVRELSVGDTDAPFVDWPDRHDLPTTILDID